jgi:hypothetical protein
MKAPRVLTRQCTEINIMPTMTKRPNSSCGKIPPPAHSAKAADDSHRVRLNTSAEVRAYLAAHLTPVRYGPKGQPIYAQKDIEKLNVIIRPGV